MKYNLNNNWHRCEPEIDVNSALICCLIPQHFTRGKSTYDFHQKLWSNEPDLSWIIPWFLPSKDKFCLQWPETHPLWPGRSIILPSYLAAYCSSWNNQVLFATPLTVCNSDNALEQVVEFTLKLSQPLCPHGSIVFLSRSLSFIVKQPVLCSQHHWLFIIPITGCEVHVELVKQTETPRVWRLPI